MRELLSAADVGVIGSADGPTAIFVSVSPDGWGFALGAAVAAALIAAVVALRFRKRR